MARTPITKKTITATGYNLTDATPTTLGTGAGNGVSFTYTGAELVTLINDSGGPAEFTVKIPTEAKYAAQGITVDDVAVTVADGKTYLYPAPAVAKQVDGAIYIDCDVAGKVLVLDT